jgi:hypothetical protein
MIHLKTNHWQDGTLADLTIKIDDEQSLRSFQELVDRALNCWDSAPKDLKELGDILTHGRITQDHASIPERLARAKE